MNYGAKSASDLVGVGQADGGRVWEFAGRAPVQAVLEAFSKGVHRALVNADGVRRLLTQTDVLRWVSINTAFEQFTKKTLDELGLAHGEVISVPDTASALDAFRKASQNEVSAIAVVDHHNKRLMGNLSCSDIRSLDGCCAWKLSKNVVSFLVEVHPSSLNPIVVHKGDSLKYALFKMLSLKIHRVWVCTFYFISILVFFS